MVSRNDHIVKSVSRHDLPVESVVGLLIGSIFGSSDLEKCPVKVQIRDFIYFAAAKSCYWDPKFNEKKANALNNKQKMIFKLH